MPTPVSGGSSTDVSTNLGDTGKLDSFMSSLNTAGTDESPPDNNDTSVDESESTDEAAAPDTSAAPVEATITDQGVITPNKQARDYTGIDPEDVPVFKQMSNKAFDRAVAWYKSHREGDGRYKELEGNYNKVKDFQYYQHPNAYQLSDDYNRMARMYTNSEQISNHWANALANLEEQKPIQDLLVDPKTGELSLGQEIPYSPALKAKVISAMQRASSEGQAALQKLTEFKGGYESRYKEFDGHLDQISNSLLSEVRKNPQFQELEKGMQKLIPPELRGNKQFQLIAGMGAFIKAMTNELNNLRAQVNGKTAIKTAARANGPGTGKPANGSGDPNNVGDPTEMIKGLMKHVGRA